jgi:fatty-acid desaturase
MQVSRQANQSVSKYWIVVAVFTTIVIAFRFWIMPDYRILANVVVSVISAFLLAIIIVPIFLRLSLT